MKFKILKSSTNTPDVTDLTAVHRIKFMPKDSRRFDSIEHFRNYINNPKNAKNIVKSPNNIRYLNTDITQQFEVTMNGKVSEYKYKIKKGLIFDGGSLPIHLQALVRDVSRLGYCIHDENYKYQSVFNLLMRENAHFRKMVNQSGKKRYYSRLVADSYMKANHIYRNVAPHRRLIAFSPLRAFGSIAFNAHREFD